MRRFVVVSGLPGSGKTTLAQRLSPALELPVIDKDVILEDLFASKGVGDARCRRLLSRESDLIFQQQATASEGAILVTFWRRPSMAVDSGTPTGWLFELPGYIVHVCCVCPPEIAVERLLKRRRHPGHLDSVRSRAEALTNLRAIASLAPIAIGPRLDVDTTREVHLDALVCKVNDSWASPEEAGHRT